MVAIGKTAFLPILQQFREAGPREDLSDQPVYLLLAARKLSAKAMSNNSTGIGKWWVNISVYQSDYVPTSFSAGSYVEANHDLFAGIRDNHFDPTNSDYTYGLLTLVVFFLVVGILASNLLPCLYTYLSKSYGEHLAERVKIGNQSFSKGNLLFLVTGITAIATVAGTVWGLTKTDVGLTTIEDNTQDIASDFRVVLNLPDDTSDALEGVSTAYEALLNVNCTSSYPKLVLSTMNISVFVNDVRTEIEGLSTDALDDLTDKVQGVSDAVETTKGIRKGVVWPLISFTIMMTIFLLIALGIYGIFTCSVNNCVMMAKLITPCSILMALIIWLSAAAAISMSALSGDFCIDPGMNVDVLLGDTDDANLTDIASYYTGNCSTENVIVGGIIATQEISVPTMKSTIPALYKLVEICDKLSPYVQDMDNAMYDLWSVLEDAGELYSCENINVRYQEAVYDELCTNLPEGLLRFWVSCVILAVLLLVLAVQWNRMLPARRAITQAPTIDSNIGGGQQQQQYRWWSRCLSSKRRIYPREDPSSEENVDVVQTAPAV